MYFAQGFISDHITIYDFHYLLSLRKTLGQNKKILMPTNTKMEKEQSQQKC